MSDQPLTPAGDQPAASASAYKAGLPPPPPIGEATEYRPVSGFAVAGFAMACLFGLMVLVVAAVALVKSEPFFYPAWVLLLPTTALVLSVVARNQIRTAEGTRAGAGLATAGIWISLMTGLGYVVYDRVTGLAVTSQANAFLMELREDSGFFPHLIKGATNATDFYAAMLLSLPPTQRGPVRPEDHAGIRRLHENASDGGPGALAKFRDNPVVRLITTAPPGDVTVEPLGVQSWDYENHSYNVRRIYRVTTPEAQVEFSVMAMSNEGEAPGEPRKWFVPLNRVNRPADRQVKLTRLGEALRVLRFSALGAMMQWQQQLNKGESFDFAQKDQTNWDKIQLPVQQRAYVKARVEDLFRSKEPERLSQLQFPPEDPLTLGGWKKTADGKWQVEHILKLRLEPRDPEPPYIIDGRIVMESKLPIDPMTLPNAPVDNIEWVVHSIEIARAALPPSLPTKKEGPGAP